VCCYQYWWIKIYIVLHSCECGIFYYGKTWKITIIVALFKWRIARETLQGMRPPQQLRSESYDYKIRKRMQQCLEEDPWCQWTDTVFNWRVTFAAACSRLSLMQLAPLNCVNVCKLVFVPEKDVFVTCFNFRTMYQVGGQQYVLEHYCHILTAEKSFVA